VVIGMARGGVPVANEVAAKLGAPLDVLVVRKLGAPGNAEFAIGAIASGVLHLDEKVIAALRIPQSYIQATFVEQMAELRRREQVYRRGRPALDLAGQTAIVVDDGLATGASARVAISAVRQRGPARVILAIPVSAPETAAALRPLVDQLVTVLEPEAFLAVGVWYQDFRPTTDTDVLACLDEAARRERGTLVAGRELP
jgi:predicted phosphoribosyltransferase